MTFCEFVTAAFRAMFDAFGPQHWWPGESDFEIAVGAILTQNTSWQNVEKAIENLKKRGVLSVEGILSLEDGELASLIRPAGYFNVKAGRLKNFVAWLKEMGGFETLRKLPTYRLREYLLEIKGIGPETADSILLYALSRPIFVVDAYTRRILARHGLDEAMKMDYDDLRRRVESCFEPDPRIFNELHALLVKTGKEFCRKRGPLCEKCPLNGLRIG